MEKISIKQIYKDHGFIYNPEWKEEFIGDGDRRCCLCIVAGAVVCSASSKEYIQQIIPRLGFFIERCGLTKDEYAFIIDLSNNEILWKHCGPFDAKDKLKDAKSYLRLCKQRVKKAEREVTEAKRTVEYYKNLIKG